MIADFWVVTDRSEPKYHQCLLDGEKPLFLSPIPVLLCFRNSYIRPRMDPEYMTSRSDEELVVVTRYFLLRLERKMFLHSFIQATQLSPAWRGPFATITSIGVETGAISITCMIWALISRTAARC